MIAAVTAVVLALGIVGIVVWAIVFALTPER